MGEGVRRAGFDNDLLGDGLVRAGATPRGRVPSEYSPAPRPFVVDKGPLSETQGLDWPRLARLARLACQPGWPRFARQPGWPRLARPSPATPPAVTLLTARCTGGYWTLSGLTSRSLRWKRKTRPCLLRVTSRI